MQWPIYSFCECMLFIVSRLETPVAESVVRKKTSSWYCKSHITHGSAIGKML